MENKWKKYNKNIHIFLDENCESKRVIFGRHLAENEEERRKKKKL